VDNYMSLIDDRISSNSFQIYSDSSQLIYQTLLSFIRL